MAVVVVNVQTRHRPRRKASRLVCRPPTPRRRSSVKQHNSLPCSASAPGLRNSGRPCDRDDASRRIGDSIDVSAHHRPAATESRLTTGVDGSRGKIIKKLHIGRGKVWYFVLKIWERSAKHCYLTVGLTGVQCKYNRLVGAEAILSWPNAHVWEILEGYIT